MHVSDFANLSVECLECMVDVMVACERTSRWPTLCRFVLMPMLEKESGGHRLIGVFGAFVRLWAGIRSSEVSKWEAASL